jgi:hypothetical protein
VAPWGDKYHGGVPADHFDKAGRYLFADPQIADMAEVARATRARMANPLQAVGTQAYSGTSPITISPTIAQVTPGSLVVMKELSWRFL